MPSKQKWPVLGLIVLLAGAGIFYAVWRTSRPVPQAGEKEITVEVVHGDGSEKSFTYQTDEEYLGALLQDEGLIAGTESEYGLYVTTVDGETADYDADGAFWWLSCNGEDAQTGADQVVIADGDVYTWTYTVG